MTGFRVQTLRLRNLSAVDRSRLRRMPVHPVHASAMDAMHAYAEGRIVVARDVSDDIRGYLTYHDMHHTDNAVMLDYLYSPWGGGCGTRLMHRFESMNVGKTVLLMPTIRAVPFYERLGYRVDSRNFMLTKHL